MISLHLPPFVTSWRPAALGCCNDEPLLEERETSRSSLLPRAQDVVRRRYMSTESPWTPNTLLGEGTYPLLFRINAWTSLSLFIQSYSQHFSLVIILLFFGERGRNF